MVNNLQTDSEIWNRNVDILNLITYGQLTTLAGNQRRSLRQIYEGCWSIFQQIGPMMYEDKVNESINEEGMKIRTKQRVKGLNTPRFRNYYQRLTLANNYILASENREIDYESRYAAAEAAYNILQSTQFQLLQDVDSLGLNKKDKNPSYNAGLTGS